VSEKRKRLIEEGKLIINSGGSELDRWFNDRHIEMTGTCMHCGGVTEKGKPTFRCSVAHLFPKAYFKSVSTNPDNYIELCFYGKSCHTNFDHGIIDIIELSCFDKVIEKFIKIYPFIDSKEKRRIPDVLLNYLETEL